MTPLIKRLRSPEFADVAEKYLMWEAADEIEKLEAENKLMAHCEGVTRDAIRKQVIEEMREYAQIEFDGFDEGMPAKFTNASLGVDHFLDAYEKDRG